MEGDNRKTAIDAEAENSSSSNGHEMVVAGAATASDDFSDEELRKIGMIRTYVASKDPCFKQEEDGADTHMLRRFLRARDMDVDKSGELFCKYLKWRRVFIPKGFITESEIPNELGQNKLFLQGVDKTGRPIVVVLAARHFHHKQGGVEEFKRMCRHQLH